MSDGSQTFSSGAVRDSNKGKPRPDLISPYFLTALGNVLAKGAQHYGERNWERGMPLSRIQESKVRHMVSAMKGRKDEPHWAMEAINLMMLIHGQEMIRLGHWPKEYDDLPVYEEGSIPVKPPEPSPLAEPPYVLKELVYVSGPFTAPTHTGQWLNTMKALEVGEALANRGYLVHVPHGATVWYGSSNIFDGQDYEWFMELDRRILLGACDALFFMGPSPGADRELAWAKARGLKIWYNLEEVPVPEGGRPAEIKRGASYADQITVLSGYLHCVGRELATGVPSFGHHARATTDPSPDGDGTVNADGQ